MRRSGGSDGSAPSGPAAALQQSGQALPGRRKAGRKQTDSGLTVHSFRSIIDQLGTLVAYTVEPVEAGATFQVRTRPTPLQLR